MTLEGQYEYYRCMQHDFNEAYKLVNRYVADIYMLPKKFVEDTGPTLDNYIKGYSFPAEGDRGNSSFQNVVDFIEQLDEFSENTLKLYNEHKMHADRSKSYLRRIEELNQKNSGKIVSEFAIDYIELTPELTQLHKGLKQIKEKADEMVDKLERLELRWERLRVKVSA
jgi:uncharacterized protein YlzI (FlbEa/FlbD family)